MSFVLFVALLIGAAVLAAGIIAAAVAIESLWWRHRGGGTR